MSQHGVYIADLGIACSLGREKKEVSQNLFSNKRCLNFQKIRLFSGRDTLFASLPFEPKSLPSEYEAYDSRNNRLLKVVLDEIKPKLNKILEKFYRSRIGVVLATSTSGMENGETAFAARQKTGRWPENYHYSQQETASPSLFTAEYLGINGPSYTVSTACSAGTKAIISAKRLIKSGICDAVICGGVDTFCKLTVNGFDSLGLVSEGFCTPFDQNRDGITLGEGATVFILSKDLSEFDVELLGCGESSDAYHMSSPDPSGTGAKKAIQQTLDDANLKAKDISYINLHGTGTTLNDSMEGLIIHELFGTNTSCSSTKSVTGHTLAASGALEAGFLWLALQTIKGNKITLPPQHGVCTLDPEIPVIDLISPRKFVRPIGNRERVSVLSNSFAFGGSNASLILSKKIKEDKKYDRN